MDRTIFLDLHMSMRKGGREGRKDIIPIYVYRVLPYPVIAAAVLESLHMYNNIFVNTT